MSPRGTHPFELPSKIGLPRDAYLLAQGLYRGWALFGFVSFAALAANLALAAGALIALVLVVLFAWTYPADLATENWTRTFSDWEVLRRRWEYSHAANARLAFLALCLVVLSVLDADGPGNDRA